MFTIIRITDSDFVLSTLNPRTDSTKVQVLDFEGLKVHCAEHFEADVAPAFSVLFASARDEQEMYRLYPNGDIFFMERGPGLSTMICGSEEYVVARLAEQGWDEERIQYLLEEIKGQEHRGDVFLGST